MTKPHYDFHVFICQNQRPQGHVRGCCLEKGSQQLLNYMKARVKELGIPDVRVNKSGCLDQCEQGVALVIYPEGAWYRVQTTQDIDDILEYHLQARKPIERLLMG